MSSNQPPDISTLTGRAIILCCDGTGNIWGNGHDTNVVKLARLIESNDQQLLYYDPGVGTTDNFPPIGLWNKSKAYVSRILGMALAAGIYEDIGNGYEFLIDNYRPGDRIYVFGFSRGAFTARSIAGMVNLYGIVRAGAKPMIPTLVRTYFFPAQVQATGRSDKSRADIAEDIRQHFCDDNGRNAWVFFTGVWDTVASVGGFRGLKITSGTSVKEKRFAHIRHAVALHEYRNKYEPRLYQFKPEDSADATRTFKQVWFAGCHSDIGGSYEEAELSDIALRWMIDEVKSVQPALQMKPADNVVGDYLGLSHDEPYEVPFWNITGLQRRIKPDDADCHPTAIQRAEAIAADPAPKNVWRPLLSRGWFWISLLAVCLLNVIGTLQILKQPNVAPWLDTLLDVWRYQRWPAEYCATDAAPLHAAGLTGTCWDFAMLAAYPFLLVVLLVHAHRRLNTNGGLLPAALDRFASQWPLLILVLADLGEDLTMTHWLSGDCAATWMRHIVYTFSTVKYAALVCVGMYLLLGLCRSPNVSTSPA